MTDRADDALRLRRVLAAVEPCSIVSPDRATGPRSEHAIIVCDAPLDTPTARAALKATLAHHGGGTAVPILYLVRHQGEDVLAQAQAIGATAILPRNTSDAQVLFTVRRLIDGIRSARQTAPAAIDPAVAASLREAGVAFTALFDAAKGGRHLLPAGMEQGGNAVVSAVGQGRIGLWLDVVRQYDDVTYQHCLLVAGLVAAFAVRMGLSLKGQRLLAQAALVHDIGKARIPHAILNKAGPLSRAERELMQTHSAAGHDMLQRQGGFDAQLLDIVRHHHEYLDGSGYPDSLQAGDVSTAVRMVTICDIYAALIERRAYKAPIPPAAAFAVLAEMGGKLDIGLVAAFREMIEVG